MAFPVPTSVTESFSDSNTTSHAVALDQSTKAGDLLIMVFSVDGAPAITNIWTLLYKAAQGTTNSGAAFAKISTGSEASSVDVVTDSTEAFAAQVYRYSIGNWYGASIAAGVSVGTVVASPNTGSSSPDAPAVTASWGLADNEFITCLHNSTGGTITALPANYANDVRTNAGAGTATAGVVTARRELLAASDDPSNWTSSTTGMATVTNTIVVRPYESSPSPFTPINDSRRGNIWYR